jgi:hypothetical protein
VKMPTAQETQSADESGLRSGTDRKCSVFLFNQTGQTASKVRVRHQYDGRQPGDWGPQSIKPAETFNDIFTAFYKTEDWSHDYWYIEFYIDDQLHQCKDNFYCDLKAEDDHLPVHLRFSLKSFYIGCPISGPCSVSIHQR